MRHFKSHGIVALLILALLSNGVLQAGAQGEEHEHDPFEGVTIEALGGGEPKNTPGQTLALLRITMEPGAAIDAHGHPGPVTLHVESGVFGTEFIEGSGVITRAADAGTPAPTEEAATGQQLTSTLATRSSTRTRGTRWSTRAMSRWCCSSRRFSATRNRGLCSSFRHESEGGMRISRVPPARRLDYRASPSSRKVSQCR